MGDSLRGINCLVNHGNNPCNCDLSPYRYFPKHDHQKESSLDSTVKRVRSIAEQVDRIMPDAPPHYVVGGIETIDYIKAKLSRPHEYEGYLRGNCIKYLSRYSEKGGKADLEKALKYLTWLLEVVGEVKQS